MGMGDCLNGVSRWFMDRCGEGATVLLYEQVPPLTDKDFFQYRNIPWFSFPELAETEQWKQTDISSCSLTLDSWQKWIYRPREVGNPSDAIVRICRRTDLLADVIDDKFVQSPTNWVVGDHLELWVGERFHWLDGIKNEPLPIRQWGIRISDGQVFSARGIP